MATRPKKILTTAEVAAAIRVDDDYPNLELEQLSETATSFIAQRTGHNFAEDAEINPLAKQCAILYVRQIHYGSAGYNREHDYSLGINSLIDDLKDIARGISS